MFGMPVPFGDSGEAERVTSHPTKTPWKIRGSTPLTWKVVESLPRRNLAEPFVNVGYVDPVNVANGKFTVGAVLPVQVFVGRTNELPALFLHRVQDDGVST